jgi:hypothetical protein
MTLRPDLQREPPRQRTRIESPREHVALSHHDVDLSRLREPYRSQLIRQRSRGGQR